MNEAVVGASRSTARQVEFTARLVDIVSQVPVADIELNACARADPDCLMPLAGGISNQAGEVVLILGGGFNGYFTWQSANAYPILYFLNSPLTADSVEILGVLSPQIVAGLDSESAALTVENRSVLIANARDCSGAPAAGVRVTALEGDSSTHAFYEADGLFPAAQRETTASGIARIINVPTGDVSITGTLRDGREIGISRVLSRTGFATIAFLSPESR